MHRADVRPATPDGGATMATTTQTTETRWEHRNKADELRRGAEGLTGHARARALDLAADHYHAAGLHGMGAWCSRHADRCRND
jgi:hypothetical protein